MTVISLPRVGGAEPVSDVSSDVLETSCGAFRLTAFQDFQGPSEIWRSLESTAICVNAFRLERTEMWFRHVSANIGSTAAIVVGGSDSDDASFVWPLELTVFRGVRCLRWIGWEHANYQMGLHTLKFAQSVTASDMRLILQSVADLTGANAILLRHQPTEWDGAPNPMALLPHLPSASDGYAVLLDSDFETLYRNRFSGKSRNTLRRKEKRLRAEGGVEIGWAKTIEERQTLLDTFFSQKSRQFAEKGIADAFADETIRAFYRDLAGVPFGQDGGLEIAHVSVSGNLVAISCGVQFRDKFTTLLTSIDNGPASRFSPGAILTKFQIEDACNRGLNFFDMGAGDAPHKAGWCDVKTPLFETAIAVDEKGYLATVPHMVTTAGKRFIKTQPALWRMARSARNVLFSRTAATTSGNVNQRPAGPAA